MKLLLVRDKYTARTTTGKLYIDGAYFSYTLEDTVRASGIKVKEETAIPAGIYDVNVSRSNRFKRNMPIITSKGIGHVQEKGISFYGVRIHGGNTHENTEGCILVAKNKINDDTIQGTMERPLTSLLEQALADGAKVELEVINEPQEN